MNWVWLVLYDLLERIEMFSWIYIPEGECSIVVKKMDDSF